jgi:hypothetical protein
MRKTWSVWVCFLIGCIAFMLPSVVRADVTASILGTVTDASGGIVHGVRITATNVDLNLVKETTSDASGQYRILALPVGQYKVEAAFAGFKTFVTTGIVLSVNDLRRVDIVLQVGEAQQEVSVSAESLQVEATNTQLGEVIEQKKIMELPLNGRGYIELLGLQPGVAPGGPNGGTRNEGAGTVSVNGQRENSNGFLVNGGDVSGVGNFEAQIQPNIDAVREFRLITNNFDAEYGRFSGGMMNTITKSGSNSIHGTVFEFLRNDVLDARSFFDREAPGKLRKNQFGYAVGGAAIKDKLFWFTDYQGTRQIDAGSASEIPVLSPAERQGNVGVGNLTGTVTGPYWANVLSQRLGRPVHDGQPYAEVLPDGIIPQSAFSPATVGTLQFIPLPNAGENIYASAADPIKTTEDMAGQRVDFLNKKTGDWSVYYYFNRSNVLDPKAGGDFPGFAGSTKGTRQQVTVSNTRIFGPTAVNEFRMNYTRIPVNVVPESTAPSLESMGFITGNDTLGINNSGPAGITAVPSIGLNNFSFGSVAPSIQAQNTYQIGDSFSKIHRRHSLKFGVDLRYYQMNQRNSGNPTGGFAFNGAETGYDVADYLLGAPWDFTQNSLQLLDSRSKYGAAYGQDSIQVRSNLTVNVGLRWEFSQPWYDTQDKIVTMVPGQQSTQYPTAPLGLLYPGDAGIPRTLAPTRYNNFAPRLGIAWSPNNTEGILGKLFGGPGKTSIRVGSGMFYTAIQDQTLYWILGTAPFGEYWISSAPPYFEEPFRSRGSGASQGQKFPFVIPTPGSEEAKNFDFTPYEPFQSTLGYWKDNELPYGIHFNLTVQRQLTSSTVFSIGYVGTVGRKLISIVENNPGDPKLCQSLRGDGVMPGTVQCGPGLADETFTRPDGSLVHGTRYRFPGGAFGFGYDEALWANSSYNSLQTSLEKRAGDLSFLLGYTFSKALDNASFFNNRMNYENHAISKSLSNFDNTHNFVASYTYSIPFDRAFSSAPKPLVAGWAITGITRFATGAPVFIFKSGDDSLRGTSGLERPDFVGPLNVSDNLRGSDHRWFNNDAFNVTSPLGVFGNANQRFFHGPGINNWDIGIHKDTQIREGLRVQFRAELFNAFNHAQFNAPNGFYNASPDSLFGRVNSARRGRIGQFGIKIMF